MSEITTFTVKNIDYQVCDEDLELSIQDLEDYVEQLAPMISDDYA